MCLVGVCLTEAVLKSLKTVTKDWWGTVFAIYPAVIPRNSQPNSLGALPNMEHKHRKTPTILRKPPLARIGRGFYALMCGFFIFYQKKSDSLRLMKFGRSWTWTRFAVGLASLCLAMQPGSNAAEPASTNQPVRMPPTVVRGTNTPLTSPSIFEAQNQATEVPGALTIRDTTDLEMGRSSGLQDFLTRVPGLIVQTENGVDAGETSMRGSGILSDEESIGIAYMQDGFSMNQGDGEAILEDFGLGSIKYAEIFHGAAAFKYGSITLGGAINIVSRTGFDADPFEIRLEGGSYGFFKGQAGSGGVFGPVDYFTSVTGRRRDGYRPHSAENTESLFGDLGWRINESLENRVYLTLNRTDRQMSGGVTKEQLENDPKAIDPEVIDQDLNKQWGYSRVADKLTYKTDREQASAGVYWWHRDLESRDFFNDESKDGIQKYYSDNVGFLVDSVTRTELFGQKNRLTVGLAPSVEREVDHNWENISGQPGATTVQNTELSVNAPLYVEDQQYITEKFSGILGLQLLYVDRKFHDLDTDTISGDQSANLTFRTINPKIGGIYELDPKSQVFANISRSWQPPSFDNMVEFGDEPGASLEFTPLAAQYAWTVEAGTRGEHLGLQWQLALYRSWLRNELLDVNNAQGVDLGAVNIPKSYHQGIEAGLEFDLLHLPFTEDEHEKAEQHLRLEQTYTLNDFHFDNDPAYGKHRIAGIPVHLYEAALTYQHSCGFYAGPTFRWNITKYPVDHANTLFADPYFLFGFRAGFRFKNKMTVFVEARNLTDARYPSDVEPIPDARTADAPIEIFHPGDGRSFYGGVSWAL